LDVIFLPNNLDCFPDGIYSNIVLSFN
jgi:hypothetical protein